ncbi:hypothetical protein Scep_025264 [Stephania cephalantha]|uniref:Uncharacterized protein n=1 Tax=Stephania cephalantha TaxID=152367 RepID=A0AAP0HSB6_9MAGN
MGNCTFRGFGAGSLANELVMIKVMTSNGGIMELFAPITSECVTNEFPGHGIFRSADLFSRPLPHNEELHVGELYYLLPLNTCRGARITRHGHIRPTCLDYSSSSSSFNNAPYRISALIDSVRTVAKCGSGTAPSSTANSDQWSLSSSWKASSEHYLA